MNPIEHMVGDLGNRFPSARIELDVPTAPDAPWFLDARADDRWVIVEWRHDAGFGITARPDVGFGEGADEVAPDLVGATARVTQLLSTEEHTSAGPQISRVALRLLRDTAQLAATSASPRDRQIGNITPVARPE